MVSYLGARKGKRNNHPLTNLLGTTLLASAMADAGFWSRAGGWSSVSWRIAYLSVRSNLQPLEGGNRAGWGHLRYLFKQ